MRNAHFASPTTPAAGTGRQRSIAIDLLVPLYRLPAAGPAPDGAAVGKPIGPEHGACLAWVGAQFGPRWASEAAVALANRPLTLWLARTPAGPAGFACYDATARGLFGPIGIAPGERGRGLGRVLLLAALHDMHAAGYAYAVIGGVGPAEFFRRHVDARPIEDSEPGLYRGMLRE